MGGKPKPERKTDVLKAMADYLLESGLSTATLRPAASAAKTSARMLLYHFRSKEELMVAALMEVRRRENEMLARWLSRLPGRTSSDVLRGLWRWYSSPRRAPYSRLFLEALGMSLAHPYLKKGFLDRVRKDLLPLVEEGLVQRGYPRRDARAVATFMIAAFRGLMVDLVTNRDRARLDDAMEIFILVTEVMEAKGPMAAQAVLKSPPASGRKRRAPKKRTAADGERSRKRRPRR